MSLTEQQIQDLQGLSSKTAADRLKQKGFNELPSGKKRGLLHIAFEVIKEPMFLLLVACGIIYLLVGEPQDAILLLGFVFVMMGITIYQEGKTENALDALRDLSSPRALVIRDGERIRIAGREVVEGDIIILTEGDRVPADSVVLWSLSLSVDESLLTGESAAVRKNPCDADYESVSMERPGGEDSPFVFSGTLIVSGQGVAVVKGTGLNTELGRIGKALQSVATEETLLQKETGKLVKAIFIIAIALCALVVVIYGLTRKDWLQGFLAGITLAMAMLPEEFPVVLTIFLALGAWRISQKKVLTRKMSAVETLGAATVLCSDKTGTITQNRMSIKKIFSRNQCFDVFINKNKELPEDFHELVEFGILASKKDPFDPMDKALKSLGDKKLYATEHLHTDWEMIHEYPLSRDLLALSQVWKSPDGKEYIIAAKGAPEAIADLCHLNKKEIEKLEQDILLMAKEGLRVLGVAKAVFSEAKELPHIQHDFHFEFLGLIGLEDPIRPTVPDAIRLCQQAGIRVVMITGDYAVTAQNIARQIGLENPEVVITGPELATMNPEELAEKVKTCSIYARVVPEQKLYLVNAFKKNGEIVAMTGDGVNDAPALKASHIGVAMGQRGTDVAREASDLVLLDDDFSSIVAAVQTGRRIFANLKKAMAYIVSVHIPIAGISLIPVLFQWKEIVLLPVHIVFLELIIDPACSVVFEGEPEEEGIMNKPPRASNEPLFGKRTLLLSLIQGLFSFAAVFAVFRLAMIYGMDESQSRTLSFITLIISNLCLILTNRSWSKTLVGLMAVKNRVVKWVLGGAILFLTLVVSIPFLRDIFHFSVPSVWAILIAISAGIVSILWFEILKMIARSKKIDLFRDARK